MYKYTVLSCYGTIIIAIVVTMESFEKKEVSKFNRSK